MATSTLAIFIFLALALTTAATRPLTRTDPAPLLPSAPHPTPWPEEFTIAFTTDAGAASGALYYDWSNKQQLILHGPGSSHCLARGSSGACYILENARGTFEVDPVQKKCEITSQWGTVPPTWVVPGVFAGAVDVGGLKCNRFDYPPSEHSWLETADGGEFCAFLFPQPSFTYVFAPASLKLEKPDGSIFVVPEYCPRDSSHVDVL